MNSQNEAVQVAKYYLLLCLQALLLSCQSSRVDLTNDMLT